MKDFKTYWNSLKAEQKNLLAAEAGTSYNHLCQVANGHRKVGMDLATRMTKANPSITYAMLRPDLFGVAHD